MVGGLATQPALELDDGAQGALRVDEPVVANVRLHVVEADEARGANRTCAESAAGSSPALSRNGASAASASKSTRALSSRRSTATWE